MTPLTAIILMGALFIALRALAAKRTIVPRMAVRPEQAALSERREPPEPMLETAPATEITAPISAPNYLLGGPRSGGADRTAIMMKTMSGPGICTPLAD